MIDQPIKLLKNIVIFAYLLSITSASDIVKFQPMPMQEIHSLISEELRNQGYRTNVNNMTDDLLTIKITTSEHYQTALTLIRDRHKPFELEVSVDHSKSKQQDIVRRQRSSQIINNAAYRNYRYLWLGIVSFAIILAIFYFLVETLREGLENLTPNWSPVQRALGISSSLLIFGIVWVLVFPLVTKQQIENQKRQDREILTVICTILESLRVEPEDSPVLRCWSCFKVIEKEDTSCPHCNEIQH